MTSRNEHTGDKLQTKTPSKDYLDNYDQIFKKPVKNEEHFCTKPCNNCECLEQQETNDEWTM